MPGPELWDDYGRGILPSRKYEPDKGTASRLVSLHIKGMLQAELFAASQNWLAQRRAVSPQTKSFLSC